VSGVGAGVVLAGVVLADVVVAGVVLADVVVAGVAVVVVVGGAGVVETAEVVDTIQSSMLGAMGPLIASYSISMESYRTHTCFKLSKLK